MHNDDLAGKIGLDVENEKSTTYLTLPYIPYMVEEKYLTYRKDTFLLTIIFLHLSRSFYIIYLNFSLGSSLSNVC